ncbi:acyl-CoA N-acyltransferase [Syncephalis plumigaleata]|nr:acyl-CoA N-acyltransferase [Syncephalis plumigaleata]
MPTGYEMRPLSVDDYEKGYLTCLEQLAEVGPITREQFTFTKMRNQDCSLIIVIEDVRTHTIVATGTLVIEQKFLRGCSSAGHIEDIVVDAQQRGTGFGARCYKVLLNCEEHNVGFYERCGLSLCSVQMKRYIKKDKVQMYEVCTASKSDAIVPAAATTATTILVPNGSE